MYLVLKNKNLIFPSIFNFTSEKLTSGKISKNKKQKIKKNKQQKKKKLYEVVEINSDELLLAVNINKKKKKKKLGRKGP